VKRRGRRDPAKIHLHRRRRPPSGGHLCLPDPGRPGARTSFQGCSQRSHRC
jgi:hypothetical protein